MAQARAATAAVTRTRTRAARAPATATARTTASGAVRRTRATSVRRTVTVITPPRVVEDDLEVLAAEHAARDAELLDLVARLVA